MNSTERLRKPLIEAKYLNVENTERYRCIMRLFYEKYEKLKYWLYVEEVYDEMIKDTYFSDYKFEQCQQDLSMLAEWKNLVTIQDTKNVSSIEEFKNKKYRYMMSEYSVEIERLVIKLENLFIEGSSLEPTLLERIYENVKKFPGMLDESGDVVYSWWNDLNNDFIRLNQNYQDYIRDLNSVKAEEMMRTKEFMIFKDKLVDYLRSFIKGLQKYTGSIEEMLLELNKATVEYVINAVSDYEMSIPRMDTEVSYDQLHERAQGRFNSIYSWFVQINGNENEAEKLFDATNDIIRRITRYAAQLSEKNAIGGNRKEEYKKIAEIFMKCIDVKEAHKLSAMVFGIERPFHYKADLERESESMDVGVYDESPAEFILKPRIRNYGEKVKRTGITFSREEKEAAKKKVIEEAFKLQEEVNYLTKEGMIDFANLPIISKPIRGVLLKWVSNGMEAANFSSRTDEGRNYKLIMPDNNEKCVVHCEDGNFTMPAIKLIFEPWEDL